MQRQRHKSHREQPADSRQRLVVQQSQNRYAFWLALLIALLVLLFLRPVLLPASGWAIGGADVRALFVPWLTFARRAVHAGHLPLWDTYQSAGYPFLANPQVAFFYPPTWLAFLLPVRYALSIHVALHMFLLTSGTLVAARKFGASWLGAVLAALSIGFSSFVGARILAGHIGVLATFSWLPWLLWASWWTNWKQEGQSWRAVLSGVPFGLAILAGHTTSLLYVGTVWLALSIYLATIHRRLSPLRNFLLSLAVGIALAAVQLVPLLQFTQFSSRFVSADFQAATEYSLPTGHLLTLLLPEYFGEPTRIGYWSLPVFEEFAYYAGILPLLALVLALRRPTRQTWLFLAMAIGGLWMALGRNSFLYEQVYALLPPFRLARAPARAAVLYTISISFLLASTITYWRGQGDDKVLGSTLRLTLTTALIPALAALAATGAVFASVHPSDTSGRLWHQVGGWVWLIVMMALGAGLLWRYLLSTTERRQRQLFAAALCLFVVADLWHFTTKMVRAEPTTPAPLWTEAAQLIGDSDERVLPWGVSIFEQNGASQVGLHSVFGYNALALSAIDELTGSVADPRSTAYDLLATGYVISGVPLDNFTGGDEGLTLIHSSPNSWIYRRAQAMPLVRLVAGAEIVVDHTQAIQRIHAPDFEPRNTVLLREAPDCLSEITSGDGERTARIIERDATSWRIETHSPDPAILVVGESAYPGWQVTVDGEPAQPLSAYTALRGVCVPAGDHIVEWTYVPSVYIVGLAITVGALFTCLWAALKLKRRA